MKRIGSYEVTGQLGRGAMGVVFEGRGAAGERVAIKVLAQGRSAPEPQRPRARVVDAPDPPEESQIEVPPGVLARLADRTRLDPGSAGAIAPLAAELRSWLDTARGGRA